MSNKIEGGDIFRRKVEHLDIVRSKPVEFDNVTTGFEAYQFVHQALPEINLSDVDLSTTLFGKKLKAPVIISSMLGGIEAAGNINRNLAQAAQGLGIGMGVGSQRCAIDAPVEPPAIPGGVILQLCEPLTFCKKWAVLYNRQNQNL